MSFTVTPWQGEPGFLTLPMAQNITAPNDPEWEKVQCPDCGTDCWLSPPAKRLLAKHKEVVGLCTMCALKKGLAGSGKGVNP